MQADLDAIVARIDALYFCPYHEDAEVEALHIADHPDRKLSPGMLLNAMVKNAIDPARAAMIRDRPSDVQAVERSGARGAMFEDGDLKPFANAILTDPAERAIS